MGSSSVLFIILIATFCSIGSFFQTQHLQENSNPVTKSQSPGRNRNTDVHSLASGVIFHSDSTVEGSGHITDSMNSPHLRNESIKPKEPERVSSGNKSGSGITLNTRPALSVYSSEVHKQRADEADSVTGSIHSSLTSEEVHLEDGHRTTEEQLKDTVKNESLTGWINSKLPVQTSVFSFMNNPSLSGPAGPCVLGVTPCTAFKNFNGTTLLWDDMRRTLAFAWELHVFGSAGLFTLMAVLAVLGTAGACSLPHPLCDSLTLSNILLIMGGALRAALLLLDPYGTRQILPHATLAALHNVPLHLLLWAQVVLALVILKGFKLVLFPVKLQYPWLVGWLGLSHCSVLLAADLYSSMLSVALPLLLQTISLCWGIPFCLGILTKSVTTLESFPSSSVPQRAPSQRTERLRKRLLVACTFLGVLCCSLQMYSLLWLYGLLGNWRRFGWGWWLTQFWARILELAWAFSMLFLGSWIFWTPSKSRARGDHWQSQDEISKRVEKKSLWFKILARMQKEPLRRSDKSWEDLLPNNWAKYNLNQAGISNKAMYDDEQAIVKPEYSLEPVSINSDSQTAFLWQKVGERECVLSLIEFDVRPPSPINLRRSIDNALYHGQLVTGGIFTPPPPSWTQSTVTDGDGGTTAFPPAYVGFRWMLDSESISASLDHFQTKDPAQSISDYNGSIGSLTIAEKEEFSAVIHQHDWSEDDVTDL